MIYYLPFVIYYLPLTVYFLRCTIYYLFFTIYYMSLIITLRCSNLTQLFLFDSFFFVFRLSFIFLDGSSSPIICPGDNFHLMNILSSASSFSLSSHFSLPAIAIFFFYPFFSFSIPSFISFSILFYPIFFSFLSLSRFSTAYLSSFVSFCPLPDMLPLQDATAKLLPFPRLSALKIH